ncbi:choline dehydrogenase [Macrophomina phaseolina]|uniref:Choline dehydrogenase n=1 Tax=Macrophomina phaseolina TaxID=35725 RepID=A0ABQ8GBT4_9PEZI|nr:choline dehydrogenase [Macrophomina phaseolina]
MPYFDPLSLTTLFALSSFACGRPINDTLLEEYDYIIVGGGPSGLTVANRLSEEPNVTVLVLEAGPVDQNEEWMRVPFFIGNDPNPPADALSGHLDYDWNLGTEPQTYLDGKSRHYPLGRGLGGGSLVNGMLWNRGNVDDYNDWATLGNPGWSWDDMLPYFQKSERFSSDVSPESAAQYGIGHDDSVHGTSGAVNVSFQQHFYTASTNFYSGLGELGIPNAGDTNAGLTAGASFLPLSIDSSTKTRADARRSHYDPVASRDNLYISTGQFATRLNLEGATQSDEERTHAATASSPRATTRARRAVILAAGAIHTPLLLQHSGIGDASFLASLNITPAIDLPGVGHNYQDHFMIATNAPFRSASYVAPKGYGADASADAANRAAFWANHSGAWTAGPPNGVAFPSLVGVAPEKAPGMAEAAGRQGEGMYLAEGVDDTVVKGWEAQKRLLAGALREANRSQFEILNDNAGHFTWSLMKPFSRGQVRVRSRDPFDVPAIDPRYGANPTDLSFFAEALRFNHRLLATRAMQQLQPDEQYPTADVVADDAKLTDLIKQAIFTEYHPTGTASMLPLGLGGVVDARLKVYGTQNLRIVDSSIMPMIPAAHLQACVYAVAEKAADLIKDA